MLTLFPGMLCTSSEDFTKLCRLALNLRPTSASKQLGLQSAPDLVVLCHVKLHLTDVEGKERKGVKWEEGVVSPLTQ